MMKKGIAIKSVCALLLLAGLFAFVSPLDVVREFAALSWKHIALLLLVSVALVWVSAAKWRLFLGPDAPSTWRLFRLYLIGYFVNCLVPSYVGGDAARSYIAGKQAGQVAAASATILERYTGLIAMFGLGLIASVLPIGAIVPIPARVVVIALALGLAVLTACVLSERIFAVGRRVLPARAAGLADKLRLGLLAGLSNRSALAEALFLSLIYHCFTVLNTAIAAHAVGWTTVPLGQLFIVLPLILTIGGLPITPSGLGLQEGAFTYFLALIGASRPAGLAIGILLRAKTYLLAVVGWVCFVLEQRHAKGSGSAHTLDAEKFVSHVDVLGTARASIVIISEREVTESEISALLSDYKITLIRLSPRYVQAVLKCVDELELLFAERGIRSALFVGIGDAASVVQALALRAPKVVRTMVLMDGTTRPHPSRRTRWLDQIEQYLPLGLPFRSDTTGFDVLPFVHRLRAPCVVAVSQHATPYQRSEAQILAARLPTALLLELPLARAIETCIALPAKSPQ